MVAPVTPERQRPREASSTTPDGTALRFAMPPLCLIVARARGSDVIGCEGRLPWTLRTDLRRFRALTTGHAVIMGRKTQESIGQPLPRRLNVVVSRSAPDPAPEIDLHGDGTRTLPAGSTAEALVFADLFAMLNGTARSFVIGGAEIYRAFTDAVDRVYLTEVDAEVDGDAHFRQRFDPDDWRIVEDQHQPRGPDDAFASRFVVYDRRIPVERRRSFAEIAAFKRAHAGLRRLGAADAATIARYAAARGAPGGRPEPAFSFD